MVVTAGGVTLTEGSDYSVDYNAGEVTILNQSIINAGTAVNVSLESNTDYAQQRKTLLGMNWQYDFSKNFQMSGTLQHLSEQALTTKVTMGSEPLNNTLWGLNINWKKESQWLTNMLDKIPFLHCTQPSQISFTGEFAQLIAGQASGVQDNASYIDDFENTKNTIDVSAPTSWVLSSVPSLFPEQSDKTTLNSGYNRALMAWYTIDPLFTRRSSSLTPAHIKGDLNQLSNYYVREVYSKELFPNRDNNNYIDILIDKGYKVAICEQMEDPKKAKGMVKRAVTRLITPGTQMDLNGEQARDNNYLAAISAQNGLFSIAYTDLSTGELKTTSLNNANDAVNELVNLQSKEVVVDGELPVEITTQFKQRNILQSHQPTVLKNAEISYLTQDLEDKAQQHVVALLVSYLLTTQKRSLAHLQKAIAYQPRFCV